MRASIVSMLVVAPLAVAALWPRPGERALERNAVPPPDAEGARLLGRLPVAFVPNVGQWEHAARYVARVGPMTVFLEDHGWMFTLVEGPPAMGENRSEPVDRGAPAHGVAVRMTFAGASAPELVPEAQLPGRHHYFLGNAPSRWRNDVPLHGAVRYREMNPGVDVRAREHDGHFEYDLLLAPGADLDPVEIGVEGIERLRIDEDGALVMETVLGPVRMPPPHSWEEGPSGERSLIACRYVLRGERRFGFEAPLRRQGWAMVVDPGLLWSTFLGGASHDLARAVAVTAQDATIVAGSVQSPAFPTTPGAFDPGHNGGSWDLFVSQLSPSGASLVYSTFVGGTMGDFGTALAVDAQGVVTVAGSSSSADFPTTPGAFDTSYNGGTGSGSGDVVVARLSSTGANLVYSTFVGGTIDEYPSALAVDAQGAATVVGTTLSADFPTTPAAYATAAANWTAFVTRLTPAGSGLVYSTYLGGSLRDYATGVATDAFGRATVVGYTESANFPTTQGAFDRSYNGGNEGFVTRLTPTGSGLDYSTFLGGADEDRAQAVALDRQGAAVVVGLTRSFDFPATPGAFQGTCYGYPSDAFVVRLTPTGSGLAYATFLGGVLEDEAQAVVVDAQGVATVAGFTNANDFPVTPGAFDTTFNGYPGDVFVTRLTSSGTALFYSTYFGGALEEQATAIALDAQGAATVVGYTLSANLSTTPGAFDPSHNGNTDAFVARLDMLPTGVAAFGRSTRSCSGPLAISVSSMPRVGNGNFSLTVGNVPANSPGLLAYAGAGLQTPTPLAGVELWIDPTQVLVTSAVFSSPTGAYEAPFPIPNNPAAAGIRLFAQFLWLGPAYPPPCPPQGVSASNALDFTIQP